MADGRYAPMLPPSPPPGLSHSLCFDSCDLTDQVGRMDASLVNGATCSIGQGIVLDGRDDFVELADAPQGGAMSLAMWLKLDTLTQADGGNPNPNPDPNADPNPNPNPNPDFALSHSLFSYLILFDLWPQSF